MIATPSATRERAMPVARELVLADLLHDFDELERLLAAELERQSWLDAFLLAAGMNQVVEDYLHRDLGSLAKVAGHLRGARSLARVRRLGINARALTPRERSLLAWQSQLSALVLAIARHVAGESAPPSPRWRELLARSRPVTTGIGSEVLRLPTCFRSLDLTPDDMRQLVARFAECWPDRSRPLIVVGVRTSGSYLAPLQAAYLLQEGFERLTVRTVRPGHELLDHERRALKQAAARDAIAVVVDDPPSSGRAVARAASLIHEAGFPFARIVLSLPLLGTEGALPEPLRAFERVVLERETWAVEKQLQPASIRAAIQGMPGLEHVESIRRLHVPPIDDPWEETVDRRHVRALYELQLRRSEGQTITKRVYAKGVGLGYFGRHSLAVAEGMRDYLPQLYGLRGGLLFRAWQPNGKRMGAKSRVDHMPERIAGYVHARSRALPTQRDLSQRMVGRQAVWQRTADMLMEPFGRLRLLLRPFVHRLARDLVRVEDASVVDGSMGLHHWFVTPGPEHLTVKVDNDERAFSNEDIYSYDAAYDLSAAGASLRSQLGSEAAHRARAAYEEISGKRLDEERWFLYQLLTAKLQRRALRHNLNARRADDQAELIPLLESVETALEDSQRDYVCACILTDVGPRHDGPLCAIDVDGTLETAPLGFTSIGPSGALALRALAKHGYRAVLASGRSLDAVRKRCKSYKLAAGVAEYGAVVYDATREETVELLTEADRANLSRVRSLLAGIEGVHLDGRHMRSVRAFTLDDGGRRRGLPSEMASAALGLAGVRPAVVAVPGWSQTDFVCASITKADGLRVAAGRIGSRSRQALFDLAVGDAMSDLPMFGVARMARVPANGDPGLQRNGVRFMSGYGQDGLAEAVGHLIGHEPGRCKLCQLPHDVIRRRLLLDLMGGYEKRGWGRMQSALSLAWSVFRAT